MANKTKKETDASVGTIDPTPDANRDPITGEPGSHPAGTAVGGAGGAATGAAVGGALGGPVGAVVGAAVGAVAGGAAGHAAGEALDPTIEESYWRENYSRRPYVKTGRTYEYYEPAYRYGWESAVSTAYVAREFDEAEPDLATGWARSPHTAHRKWNEVKSAVRDAWDRVRGRRRR
jgi:hypothetical protein